MQGFVRKGLLLSVATGALVLGGGAAAKADTAVVNGSATGDSGAASGNVAQVGGGNPINVCGDAGTVGTVVSPAQADQCTTAGNSAAISGATAASPGAASGNVVGAALDAPVQACGVGAHVAGTGSGTAGNTCANTGTSATVTGTATNAPGVGSGNVIQLSENAPVNACGDSVGAGSFDSAATGDACLNVGAPVAATPVLPPSPVGASALPSLPVIAPLPVITPPVAPVVAPPVSLPAIIPTGVPALPSLPALPAVCGQSGSPVAGLPLLGALTHL